MTSKTLPFHADTVGSYLRSQPLKEARAKFAAGELSREQLTEVEDQEIAKLVQAQLDAGIQVITDGEYRRAFWHIDFLEHLNGIEGYHPEHGYKILMAWKLNLIILAAVVKYLGIQTIHLSNISKN